MENIKEELNENAKAVDEKTRTFTTKSAMAAIAKLKKKIATNEDKINELNQENKEYKAEIKKYEEVCENIAKAETQKLIEEKWYKEGKISPDQIAKLIELGRKLSDKNIDILDVDEAVEAVALIQGNNIASTGKVK